MARLMSSCRSLSAANTSQGYWRKAGRTWGQLKKPGPSILTNCWPTRFFNCEPFGSCYCEQENEPLTRVRDKLREALLRTDEALFHSCLRAVMGSRRAARMAGATPKIMPIKVEKPRF